MSTIELGEHRIAGIKSELERMMEMREEGKSNAEIADELGTTRYRVWSILGSQSTGTAAFEAMSELDKMAALRAEGLTNVQIAERLGVTRHRVGALLGPSGLRGRPKKSLEKPVRTVVRLTDSDYERLVAIAEGVGIKKSNAHNRPSQLTTLLEAIASGKVKLSR